MMVASDSDEEADSEHIQIGTSQQSGAGRPPDCRSDLCSPASGVHKPLTASRTRQTQISAPNITTKARERLWLPRREASNDPLEDDGNCGSRGPVSGRLHVRRSWGEADGRRAGSAASPGACSDPRPEAASPGSRPRWREPWRGCFSVAALEIRPSGVPSRWRNPDTCNAGAVIPIRTYRSASEIHCREYQLTVTADGRTGQAHVSACRQPDRAWRVSN